MSETKQPYFKVSKDETIIKKVIKFCIRYNEGVGICLIEKKKKFKLLSLG